MPRICLARYGRFRLTRCWLVFSWTPGHTGLFQQIGERDGDVQSSVQGYQRWQIVRFKQIAGECNPACESVAKPVRWRMAGTRLQARRQGGIQYRTDDSDAV